MWGSAQGPLQLFSSAAVSTTNAYERLEVVFIPVVGCNNITSRILRSERFIQLL